MVNDVQLKTKDVVADNIKHAVFDNDNRDKHLEQIAWRIVHHPKLRAEYFADPDESLKEANRKDRHKLSILIELLINEDPRFISAKETFHERESFLSQGVQDPQKTFGAVVWMSKFTFGLGVAMVIVGVVLAVATLFVDKGTAEQVTVGSLGAFFGGSGLATTLLAVFRASTKELRRITSDMAKIHMILTGYGAQTTALRATEDEAIQDAAKRNDEYRNITEHAVSLLPSDSPRSTGDEKKNETTEQDVAG